MTTFDAEVVSKFGIENSIRIHQSLPKAINAFYGQVKNVIENENFSWEFKYNMVFKFYQQEFKKAGVEFDYYDPDTSYQEDAMAWFNALTDYLYKVN